MRPRSSTRLTAVRPAHSLSALDRSAGLCNPDAAHWAFRLLPERLLWLANLPMLGACTGREDEHRGHERVGANSPTSGNERLVLLALADACSRDDRTGCWPSAATIARKVNISDRTVRRVIAELDADGHLAVHRGGGRAGRRTPTPWSPAFTAPGQNDTP
jgi:hypothetical protein